MTYDFSKINILVIENNAEMFELTNAVLKSFGVDRVWAAYGFDEGFRSFQRHKPDLIIMDWLEEPRNGLELTKKIRTDATSVNPYIPIILMSGYNQQKKVERARDSGITSFITKPYTAKDLYKKIEFLVENPRPFVKSDKFVGPDRRHNRNPDYKGPDNRQRAPAPKTEAEEKPATPTRASEMAKNILKRKKDREGLDG